MLTITEREVAEALRRDPDLKPFRSWVEFNAVEFKYGLDTASANDFTVLLARDDYERSLVTWWNTHPRLRIYWTLPMADVQTLVEVPKTPGYRRLTTVCVVK